MSVRDRRILVVGGTRGIGRAIALQLLKSGAHVTVTWVRDRGGAEALASQEPDLHVVRADATSADAMRSLADSLLPEGAPLHSLVFAAATGVHRDMMGLTSRHFDFTFDLNVKAFLSTVQLLSPRFVEGSTIVAISSEGAARAMPQYHLVGASKAALESLARHMAVELAGRGVRLNILSPGAVETDAWAALPDSARRLAAATAASPRGRLPSLQEIALAAQFLLSDASAGLVGHTLVVDGGARIVGTG